MSEIPIQLEGVRGKIQGLNETICAYEGIDTVKNKIEYTEGRKGFNVTPIPVEKDNVVPLKQEKPAAKK